MIPILSIPILVSQHGEHFKEVFSEGEYEHFQRYLSRLINKLQQQLNLNIEGSLAFWRRATQAQCLFVLIQWGQMAFHKGWSIQRIMEVLLPAYGLAA